MPSRLREKSRTRSGAGLGLERRIKLVLLFFVVLGAALLGRLFILQIIEHDDYTALAARQQGFSRELQPERGVIFAKDREDRLIPLALNKTWHVLAASPKNISDPVDTASVLARELGLDEKEILAKLSKEGDPYELIAGKIDPSKSERLKNMDMEGLFFEEEKRRIYPHVTLGAHILGFVSREEQTETGKYGLERAFERSLSGNQGFFEGVKDAAGFWVAIGRRLIHPPRHGSDVVLTLDYNIQVKAEEALERVQQKWGAAAGHILVLDPASGKILALASRPVFDPNDFSKEKDFAVFLNPLAEAMYELGSVVKPLTLAAAVNENLIKADSVYYDPGELRIGGYKIANFDGKSYGRQTMTEVLEKSLNTGAVYAARLLGQERQYAYLKSFGFGERTGIDLPGELAGNISNLEHRREIDYATASFGQGIALTPLQMAAAMGALANQGKIMKPYIVEKIIDDSGNEIKNEPEMVRSVISTSTAEAVTKMLVSAVRNGFENRAGVKGYFVAGKTGTAQIPSEDRRGYSDKVIHTFAGYAPAFNPKFLIYLQLNEPKGNRFAANTLTPAFHDLAEYILNYYEIPPDESESSIKN